jgi:hypothetical protein
MKREDVVMGAWYNVAGRGPMQATSADEKQYRSTIVMMTPGGCVYWAGMNELTRPIDKDYLTTYERDSKARGFDVADLKQIWEWLDHAQPEVRLP